MRWSGSGDVVAAISENPTRYVGRSPSMVSVA
jgi:hypothetical protein